MDLIQAINTRRSVREYENKFIDEKIINDIKLYIEDINKESGLNIQLVINEPKAFDSFLAHYGKFSSVKNYIALVAKKGSDVQEKIGYYGEKIVLYAQTLDLNTCWVALTYKKIKNTYTLKSGEKLHAVIALGHGKTQGKERKSKTLEQVSNVNETSPKWFVEGVKAALKAPTAINQQKFYFVENGGEVRVKAGKGFYTKMDLGIVKYHFEIGAGVENFRWKYNN